ncbi:flagellar hook-length control protein FliK [Novosphingobium colocasiae]|uniref:flagellar hook-length control protein FliK n=1 Tax=Novosphingobium colocasiae TaxID=1256513 RepID=UPI0035AEE695
MPVRALPPLPTPPAASGVPAQPAGAEPGAFQAVLATSGGGESGTPVPAAADRRDPATAVAAGVDAAASPGLAELCLSASEPIAAPAPVVTETEPVAGQASETQDTPPADKPVPPPAAARPPVAAPVQTGPVVTAVVAEAAPLVTPAPAAPVASPTKRKGAAGDASASEASAPADRPVACPPASAPVAVAAVPAPPVAGKATPSPLEERAAPMEARSTGHATGHAAAEPAAPAPPTEARVSAPLFSQTLEAAVPRAPAQPYDASPAATATVTVREGRFGADVGVAIARARESVADGGGDALLIRLDPRHLGRIDVRMTFDDDGTMRAVMRADSPAALDLLRRESVHLDRALADAGIRADAQSLRFESGGGGSGQHESARHRGFTPSGPPAEFQPVADGAHPDLRSLRGSGQLDVLA